MKIIVSPAKTQQNNEALSVPFRAPQFKSFSETLLSTLRGYDEETIGKLMSIKGTLLEETLETISKYNDNEPTHGIRLYTGLVFKGLESLNYSNEELEYLDEHVRILSAFYGVVHPFDSVRPYRLDMKMKVIEGGLYKYWKEPLDSIFEGEEIINLASGEFSKMIKHPMTTIDFKEEKESGVYKIVGTYAKQARGKMLAWMIQNNIQTIEAIKSFAEWGYVFNEVLSTKNNLIFTRSQKLFID